jgi:hypothetical protein
MLAIDTDFVWSQFSPTGAGRKGATIVETFVSQPNATPLPIRIGCDALFYPPTGHVVVYKPVHEIVAASMKYANDVAVLPISDEDEATVAALLKRRLAPMKSRRL